MSAAHHRLLWLWGGLLAALLCLLFLPLTGGERGFAILLVAAAVTAGLVVAGRRPGESAEGEYGLNDLPDTPYRLPVVLVCGDRRLAGRKYGSPHGAGVLAEGFHGTTATDGTPSALAASGAGVWR
jgi:hypothetical protein